MREHYLRIDGFVLCVDRHNNKLELGFADEHDRNELLRYFASAIHNHELAENLKNFTRINESGVLWYYPIKPEEFARLSMVVEFSRVRQDYEHTRGTRIDEPVWTYNFVPTMLHSTYIADSTLRKLIEVSKMVAEGRTDFPDGVEVYSIDDWALKFDRTWKKGLLLPSILQRLDEPARRYAALFEKSGRDYSPDQAEFWRREVCVVLEQEHLMNCEVSPMIFEQLGKFLPLSRCVNAAEYLRSYLDLGEKGIRIQDCLVSLDWVMFEPYFPDGVDDWDGLHHCLKVMQDAKLEVPRTLPTEIAGEPYRILTGWDHGHVKLLHALPIATQNMFFKDVYLPSYLELVEWASFSRGGAPAMEWDIVVNWDERLDWLADLASDTSLPEAEYLHHCLYCHLAGLRQHEPRKMLDLASGLAKHHNPAIRRIAERTRALASGEMGFVYDDWFSRGFLRQDAVDQVRASKRKK
ncbi:MAG TPA: hypothetical protein PK156_48530 [Polyangium sp.]|nr:hypothetical protein [Polyangium sp.]